MKLFKKTREKMRLAAAHVVRVCDDRFMNMSALINKYQMYGFEVGDCVEYTPNSFGVRESFNRKLSTNIGVVIRIDSPDDEASFLPIDVLFGEQTVSMTWWELSKL
jgi:hypothetical protein